MTDAYRCPFEILAPLALEGAQVARVEAAAGALAGPFVSLFICDGIGNGWATYYRRRSGSLKRMKRLALPVRATAAEAEYDLISYADKQRWFKRSRSLGDSTLSSKE